MNFTHVAIINEQSCRFITTIIKLIFETNVIFSMCHIIDLIGPGSKVRDTNQPMVRMTTYHTVHFSFLGCDKRVF